MPERTVVHDTIVTERTYGHPPDRVFAAWRDPATKREWFAEGEGWRIEEYGLDFRVGGREHGRFRRGNGPETRNETVYLDIVPNRRIVMAYTMALDGRNISASLGTVEFEAVGGGTRLIYTEQGAFFDGADGPSSRKHGWNGLLERLAAALLVAVFLLTGSTPAAAQAVPGRVKVSGMQMYYEVSGAGDPLVVLHGAYMNIPSMGAIVPRLARTHKVYAVELQGHGRTTDIDRPITYQHLADDVAGFMDAVGLKKADVFGYSMGAIAGLQLAIRHPQKVNRLVAASVAYDLEGWQPEFQAAIPQMKVEDIVRMPFAAEYRKLAPNPDGFPALAEKLIALEKEPMAWDAEVRALKTPVLIITGDADVATLEHSVALFRLLGGGVMGDMGKPLPASRLAVLPATSHTAVITQPDLLHAFIEPFLKGQTPKGMFEQP